MPYFVYILQSRSNGRHYCGFTGSLQRRLRQHNDAGYRGSKTTKRFQGPWELIWKEEFATRSEAICKERDIKKRGIGRFLRECTQLAESRLRRD